MPPVGTQSHPGAFAPTARHAAPASTRVNLAAIALVAIAGLTVVALIIGNGHGNVLAATDSAPRPNVTYTKGSCETVATDGKTAVSVRAVDQVTTESWSELWIIYPDGKTVRVRDIVSPASWSADSSWCVAHTSELQLIRVDLGGREPKLTKLGVHGLLPKLSRDGKIAFSDAGRMKVRMLDSSVVDLSAKLAAIGDCEGWQWSDGSLSFSTRMPGEVKQYVYCF